MDNILCGPVKELYSFIENSYKREVTYACF
jgi:hypothetical protein